MFLAGCSGGSAPSILEIERWEGELFEKINTDRRLAGVKSLERDEILDRVAGEIAFLATENKLESLQIRDLLREYGITAYIIAGHIIASFENRSGNMANTAHNELIAADDGILDNPDFRTAGVAVRYFDGEYFAVFVGAHLVETDANGNLKPIITARLWERSELLKYEEEHLAILNKVREENELTTLEKDDQLAAFARAYAEKMLKSGFFGHNDPAGKGFVERIDETSMNRFSSWGENLASLLRTENPSADAMQRLMESPGHRANILRPGFTHVGVGVATDGRWWIFVQIFGIERRS